MADLLTPVQLAEIEAREKAATPGPWEHQKGHNGDKWRVAAGGHTVCKVWTHNKTRNAPFIAHARSDIPALLAHGKAQAAHIRHQAAENKRLREDAVSVGQTVAMLILSAGGRIVIERDLMAEFRPGDYELALEDRIEDGSRVYRARRALSGGE